MENERPGLKRVSCYLLAALTVEVYCVYWLVSGTPPAFVAQNIHWFLSAAVGGVGGVVYCLRAVYLNACVFKTWSYDWLPWYFLRPILSLVCGALSYAVLRAGLLVLDSDGGIVDGNPIGFYVLAFVAGLNVDRFLGKVEEIAQATWGIGKSRASDRKEVEKKD